MSILSGQDLALSLTLSFHLSFFPATKENMSVRTKGIKKYLGNASSLKITRELVRLGIVEVDVLDKFVHA